MRTKATEGHDREMFCQIHCIGNFSQPLSPVLWLYQMKNRLKRYLKRRMTYMGNSLREMVEPGRFRTGPSRHEGSPVTPAFRDGELIRVKSRAGIQATLSKWNDLKGCGFMEEMWPYCGTEQRVLTSVRQFLDERNYRIRKCRGVYLLDGVRCRGTRDFGECDRLCYYFWREEWLEKVNGDNSLNGP